MDPLYRMVIGGMLATFKVQRWDIQVTGAQHIPATGGAVLATNHVSYLDFVFIGFGARQVPGKRLVRFAAKRETFDHAVTGPLMRGMRHIPVDRSGSGSKSIDDAVELLRDGELVGMFPESTISQSFVPLPGKTGAVRMAQQAGVPIVPGALWGSQRLSTKGRPRRLRQRNVVISVDFGAPLHPGADDDPADTTTELMARIGALADRAARRYPQSPGPSEEPWWVPAHLGGTAPTPQEAKARAAADARARRARRGDRDDTSGA